MTDLDIIKQIEQDIGQGLEISYLEYLGSFAKRNHYAVDENQNVVGLDFSANGISYIPSIIFLLKNLSKLFSNHNKIKEIPPEIGQLKKLIELSFVNNQITDLPKELKQLQNLNTLSLEENHLKELPVWLGEMTSLKELSLRSNEISFLPKEILNLNLDIRWSYSTFDNGIAIKDNPLTSPPPEVIKQGRQAIIDYFNALENEAEKPLNEIKILLVGDGGVGKTSLVKRLLNQNFNPNEEKTHGINIKPFKIQIQKETQVKANLWDFGGQQIMHATHQFFLSKRSLYILVLDSREEEDPEYWLKHIESFGGDSPILIVLNKIDDNPSFEVNRPFLIEKYQGIHSFHRISCKKARGIKTLQKALSNALCKVGILQTQWPASWFKIKQDLENLQNHYISHDYYQKLCEEHKITNTAQKTLVNYLHDLGVIVHFDKFDLQETYVLEPKWVTEAVYKIINSEQLAENKGILKLNCLNEILQLIDQNDYRYPLEKQPYIIRLMEEFELCYRIDKQERILIPDLLAVAEPEFGFKFDYHTALKFKLEYDFLPRSIMPKFMVKRHKDILNQLHWRTGVVLHNQNYQATAIIKADNKDAHIQIWVTGQQKRDYFSTIRNTLWEIHDSFEKIPVNEQIPLPDKDHKGNTIYVEYQELIGHYLDNEETYYNGKLRKRYNVKQILDGIEDENMTKQQSQKTTHITVHADTVSNINADIENSTITQNSPPKETVTSKKEPAPKHWYEKWGIFAAILSAVTLALVNMEKIWAMILKIL
ncbi:COR domain-containing protein [Candidatus Albibeggiatoa sp. nov. BB20]|uniref:COR domain-containing protein n=1 Tax=Candidatus Albibeggiatoa sp. nov. BB20 TaxID=3162723 RepID=UPI0033657608